MNSFYGGKQGNSFIIAKSYTSIAEMVESFGKNKSDCPVNFDEYVLINTINKNNPENGQIFRRGYDYNDDKRTITSFHPTKNNDNPYETKQIAANGAVYIGTIVGPAGRAPIFHFDHYDKVDNLSKYKTLNPNALFTYSLRRVNETSISKFLYDYYKKTKIDKDVILGELNYLTKDENFHDLLAMMVKEDVTVKEIADVIKANGGAYLEEVKLFDVYQGAQIEAGHKSVAYSIAFRSAEKTLSDADIADAMDAMLKELAEKLGAQLRDK